MHRIPWGLLIFAGLAAGPFIPLVQTFVLENNLGSTLPSLFIGAILGLALNVVLGNAGQLHLGIAAFYGIGAFTMAILQVAIYPFQWGFWPALLMAALVSAFIGIVLSSPTLRLRGDYLALVTLGFGVITITLLRKFDEITGGKQTLNPIPTPKLPEFLTSPYTWWDNKSLLNLLELGDDWSKEYRLFYFLTLGFLAAIYWLLRNIERSRLGRAWLAVREDELAATCMGINAARMKLAAFALSAGIAGLAGGLYAVKTGTTNEPTYFDFSLSVTVLCAVILGGLGSRNGVLLGILFINGFELILAPQLDSYLQKLNFNPEGKNYLKFSNWKLMIFGLALLLMMRFRPYGIIPERRANRG